MQAPTGNQPILNPTEAWWAGLAARDDRSASVLLQTEAAGGRFQRSVYELFSEMEEKDGHLYSVIQTRLNGVLGLRRRVVPAAPGGKPALDAAALASAALDAIPRFEELLRALLDGISKGFAVVELVWGYDAAGRITIADWVAHPQEWFSFDDGGRLLLLAPPFRAPQRIDDSALPPAAAGRNTSASRAIPAPPRKFLVLRFGADFRNPYGRGLAQRAYWYYFFKKNALKFWAVYNERYGAPTAIASYGPGTTDEERRRLRDILAALQTDSGIVIPECIELQLLEQTRPGNGETYREFLDWCNDEVSKIVLGATLTSGEGRRSGSLALGNVHQLVRQDYIDADAAVLQRVLTDSLIRWICVANLGENAPLPRLHIETESPGDLNERIKVDHSLLSIGVTLPQSYFYEQYGRPAPTDGENTLRYDDANFYGYHLQYGVLTINEVRRRLNLPAVSWGDRPTGNPDEGVELPGEDKGIRPV